MKKYRITFVGENDLLKNIDIEADDREQAFSQAFQMPEAKNRHYNSISCQEIPAGASVIGIQFIYTDTVINKRFNGYLFIKAMSEKDAVAYYNRHYKGKSFWFDAGKIEANGKHIYGDVVETYFATFSRYDADATREYL